MNEPAETDEVEKMQQKIKINSTYGSYGNFGSYGTIPTSASLARAVHKAGLYAELQRIEKHNLSEEYKERIAILKDEIKHHELYYPEYYL